MICIFTIVEFRKNKSEFFFSQIPNSRNKFQKMGISKALPKNRGKLSDGFPFSVHLSSVRSVTGGMVLLGR